MFGLVSVSMVGVVGLIATLGMVLAMVYMAWVALGDDTHRPSPDTGNEPEPAEK